MINIISGQIALEIKKRRAMTNRSPNPNLKNYQNEKINLNVNRFEYLYAKEGKGYPFFIKKNNV
jgi:hypothetical protein